MGREKLGSRLGFILLSAGCAIGIGNVWKFPYIVGENGGGIFVLIYLIFPCDTRHTGAHHGILDRQGRAEKSGENVPGA